ncbi:MAG: thiol peroxidase [Clostridium sp.]|nr:thiol peroxidase [Clostridium sp.]
MNNTVTFKGQAVHTSGTMPAVGSLAPGFTAVGGDLSEVTLEQFRGQRVVLNIFPSLDTGVCAMSVRRFNKEAAGLKDTVVLCVSMDLPFAQTRFCTTEGMDRVVPLSVFRSRDFREGYGLTLADGPLAGLMARAVFVIDEDGTIVYRELVDEVTHEPDYEKAIAAARGK